MAMIVARFSGLLESICGSGSLRLLELACGLHSVAPPVFGGIECAVGCLDHLVRIVGIGLRSCNPNAYGDTGLDRRLAHFGRFAWRASFGALAGAAGRPT